jgi:hypothetical protein
MSETTDGTYDADEPVDREQTDASDLSEEGVGGTMTDEPNTMEPEEGLPEED